MGKHWDGTESLGYAFDDGGRSGSGFRGRAGDCVVRAVAIASGRPYGEVYTALAQGMGQQRVAKGRKATGASARNGVDGRPSMAISFRVEQAPACAVINLLDEERHFYTGSGWKLARFEKDRLVGFFDPLEIPYAEDTQAQTQAAIEAALAWIESSVGEVWLVMCSCYQLCEPRRIALDDAAALAHMVRVFGEQAADL